MDGPLPRYRALVADGALNGDPQQQAALEKLQILWRRLGENAERRAAPKPRGFFGFGAKAAKKEPPLNGLYIWGGVGRGKSMLMDLFYETATIEPRRRIHFHAFMQEVHVGLRDERKTGAPDPLPRVAAKIAKSAALLCFDEVQVTDVGDAMILGRLFEGLFAAGVVIVATSNRPPDDLYKDGINRDVFVPFIAMIKDRLDILHLDSLTDHRLERMERGGVYITPDTVSVNNFDGIVQRMFRSLAGGAEAGPRDVALGARTLRLEEATDTAMRASFDTLCNTPLGASDYLKLADTFGTVMIEDVPVMGPDKRDQAKRFVTLIDALYEAKARLVISAAAEPEALYEKGDGAFEFERTASRLIEMRSKKYLERAGSKT